MPVVESGFRPAWWLPGAHLQTIAPVLLRPSPRLDSRWERVELRDGDFLDLAWAEPGPVDPRASVLALFPGLGGSVRSTYVRGMARAGLARGLRPVVIHFRGASGVPNRLARTYHAGETDDPREALARIGERYPEARILAAGFSLGGNVLLKLLGESGASVPIARAAAVSVPLDLAACAQRLQTGLSRIYDLYLLGDLKARLRERLPEVEPVLGHVDFKTLTSVEAFDEHVTAPLNHFAGAADYYARSSAGPRLLDIRIPTLVVQALDDPFLRPDIVPPDHALPSAVTVELSRAGGHVGFVAGAHPGAPEYWLEGRLLRFLADAAAVGG